MRITNFSGVETIDNVKVFKPISKLFVKTNYMGKVYPDSTYEGSDPTIRVRLIDGKTGNTKELVPEMKLSILSEIASKHEGFQRKADKSNGDGTIFNGFDLSTILIGQQIGNYVSAVDLSNDKYLDIDMRGCDPENVSYEIWGFEDWNINPFARVYQKFYLSQGELEKKFSTGSNEVLVLPLDQIKEVQFWAKNGEASPVYRREEFILDEDGRNDLVSVRLDALNQCNVVSHGRDGSLNSVGVLPISFGYSKYAVVDLTPYSSFEVRREDSVGTLMFMQIDTVPTVVNS